VILSETGYYLIARMLEFSSQTGVESNNVNILKHNQILILKMQVAAPFV
jgi:hypothetical protein